MHEWIRELERLTADLAAAVEENRRLKVNYARAIAEIDRLAHECSRLHEQLQNVLVRREGHA